MRRAFFSHATMTLVRGLIATGALLGSLGVLAAGCSLGNVAHDDCTTDAQCSSFGLGSTCTDGFCSDAPTCTTGHDCRKAAGGGACVSGVCQAAIPIEAACKGIVEPPDLLSGPAVGGAAPLIIGGIFSLEEPKNNALTVAIRLAVTDINRKGGMNGGQKLGVVFCDNGGPGNTATGDARIPLNNRALDYLAGTLGVPLIIGPLTSSDSIRLISRVKEKAYPTVIISPSATSPDLTTADDRLRPTDKHGLFWRTCPSDLLQGKVLAEQVVPKTLGNIAVVYLQDAYGEGLATVFRTTYGLTQSQGFPYLDSDLTDPAKMAAIAAKAAAYSPGGVVVIALQGSDAIKVLTAMAGQATLVTKPFFFTDGAKDQAALLDAKLPQAVRDIIVGARGTAPASPSGPNYDLLKTNLTIDPSSFSFLAQAYDATIIGAMGVVFASKASTKYDGVNVADGLARLSAGKLVNISPTEWLGSIGELKSKGQVNVEGTSGHLDFDPQTGEALGKIEVWKANATFTAIINETTLDP
jgi:ABC-type branched-subunit amino acid transport system substrate-binding protein